MDCTFPPIEGLNAAPLRNLWGLHRAPLIETAGAALRVMYAAPVMVLFKAPLRGCRSCA